MSTRTTEFAAAITGDADGAIAALDKVKARVQQTAQAAESANTKVAASTDVLVKNSEKAAKGVAAITSALYAMEAEGSARVLALGGAVGNFADLLGPQGKVVSGIAIVSSAIVALFLQAKEKAAEATRSIEANIKSLVNAGDFAAITKRLEEIERGTAGSGFQDGRSAIRNRIAQLREEANATGKSARFYRERQAAIIEEQKRLAALNEEYDRYFKALTDPKNTPRTARGLEGQAIVTTADAVGGGGKSADKAVTQLERARDAAASLFLTLSGGSAADKAAAQIQNWAESAERAQLPAAEIGRTVQALTDAFQRAADSAASKKVADDIAALTDDLAALQAEASGNALQLLDTAYAKITTELQKKAEASADAAREAERLGEVENADKLRALAAGYREQVDVAEKRRDGLKELARLSERVAAAQATEAKFTNAANASYSESVPTLADLARAESTLLSVRTQLQQLANDPKTDPAVRAEAQKLLAKVTKEQATSTGQVATETSEAAIAAVELGAGIQSSAQAALSLVQLLGDGNSELARMLSSVVSIGSGIGGLGSAASKAGGFGKLFSSGAGIASALGPLTAIAGGVVSFVGVLGRQSAAAKQRAEELEQAAERFQAGLAQFVRDIAEQDIGDFTEARNRLSEELGDLLVEAVAQSGFDPKALRGIRVDSTFLRGYLETIQAEIDRLLEEGQNPKDLINLANAIFTLASNAELAEQKLRDRQARELEDATADLEVRRLLSQGRDEEAAALREEVAARKQLEDALKNFEGAEGYIEYIRALKEIQKAEAAAAAATRARAKAIALLNDTNDVLGGTAQEKLGRSLATFGDLFPQLKDIAKGLDLSSTAGLNALRTKLRAEFEKIAKDGISEAEQPIVDAIKAIFPNIDAALEAVVDPFEQAVEAFGELAGTLEFSLTKQINGFAAIYGKQFEGLGKLLGTNFDVSKLSGDGLAGLKESIGKQIEAILADGVLSEEEQPYLSALQLFFGLIGDLIDEAAAEAEEAAEETAATAAEQRSRTRDRASGLVDLFDLTGADAVQARLKGYGSAFSDLFKNFDFTTLESIESAKGVLRGIFTELEGLSDEEILERFGMTRDEVTAALLDTDSELDDLAGSLKDVATEAREAAEAASEFAAEVNNDFLRSQGKGKAADLDAAARKRDARIKQAQELKLGPAVIAQIESIYRADIAEIEARYLSEAGSFFSGAPTNTDQSSRAGRTNTNVVGDFGGLAEITAQSLAGLLREIAINTGRQGAIVDAILGRGPLPSLSALQFPAFPSSVAGAAGVSIGTITVHVGSVAADGLSPAATGQAVAREIARELGRMATAEVRFLGSGVA